MGVVETVMGSPLCMLLYAECSKVQLCRVNLFLDLSGSLASSCCRSGQGHVS